VEFHQLLKMSVELVESRETGIFTYRAYQNQRNPTAGRVFVMAFFGLRMLPPSDHNIVNMKTVIALLLTLLAATNAIELTPETWDDATAGKTIFVKFLAPW